MSSIGFSNGNMFGKVKIVAFLDHKHTSMVMDWLLTSPRAGDSEESLSFDQNRKQVLQSKNKTSIYSGRIWGKKSTS